MWLKIFTFSSKWFIVIRSMIKCFNLILLILECRKIDMMLFIQLRTQDIYEIRAETDVLPRAYHQSLRRTVRVGRLVHCKRAHCLVSSNPQSQSREVLIFYQDPTDLPQTLLTCSIGSVNYHRSATLTLDSSQTA